MTILKIVDLYKRHHPAFLIFIKNRVATKELAEDLLQEALYKALQAIPKLQAEKKILAWFYQILRNTIADSHRQQYRENKFLESLKELSAFEQQIEDLQQEACQCYRQQIPKMKKIYKETLNLYLENHSLQETADLLKISQEQVKIRRYRAKKELKNFLESYCLSCSEQGCFVCDCKVKQNHTSQISLNG